MMKVAVKPPPAKQRPGDLTTSVSWIATLGWTASRCYPNWYPIILGQTASRWWIWIDFHMLSVRQTKQQILTRALKKSVKHTNILE